MKEKPILFSGEMVQAIMDGRKTQTRRLIKRLPSDHPVGMRSTEPRFFAEVGNWYLPTASGWHRFYCNPGDVLWVREKWNAINLDGKWWHEVKREERPLRNWSFTYAAGNYLNVTPKRWLPSIHMPKIACRIRLKVVGVDVERLHDMTLGDAIMEGCPESKLDGLEPLDWIEALWNSLHPNEGVNWDANPWVWVVKFERMIACSDEVPA